MPVPTWDSSLIDAIAVVAVVVVVVEVVVGQSQQPPTVG